jgi:hypothetical protein
MKPSELAAAEEGARDRGRSGLLARVAFASAGLGAVMLCVVGVLVVLLAGSLLLVVGGLYFHVSLVAVIGFVLFIVLALCSCVAAPLVIGAGGLQVVTLVLAPLSLRRSGKRAGDGSAGEEVQRARKLAVAAMVIGAGVLALVIMMLQGAIRGDRTEVHKREAARLAPAAMAIARYSDWPGHGKRFPPSLAAAALGAHEGNAWLGLLMRRPVPDVLPEGVTFARWPAYEKAVDDAVDYRYVGGDLPDRMKLMVFGGDIVVLYSKRSYDGGRIVVFANESVRFVGNWDLDSTFKLASIERKAHGLPPIRLDGPAPRVPVVGTLPAGR